MPLPSRGHSSCCSRPVLHEALVELHVGLICQRPKHKDAEDTATTLVEQVERKICLILFGDVWYRPISPWQPIDGLADQVALVAVHRPGVNQFSIHLAFARLLGAE